MLEWLDYLPIFLLILVRLTAFLLVAPLFSINAVPNNVKVGLAFFLALISFMMIETEWDPQLDLGFMVHVVKEAIVGLVVGFVANLMLLTVQIAGGFIDFQMGFLIANLVDPQTGSQIPVIGNFKYIMTILFLLSVNGHHLLINGIIQSYELVPLEAMFVPLGSEQVAFYMTRVFAQMFLIAFQIAIPVAGALFLVEVCLGILAKTVPQLNVFVVGLPIKIFIGLVLILITLPGFFMVLHILVERMIQVMTELMILLGG